MWRVNSRANLWHAFYLGLLVASCGQFLGITVVLPLASHAAGVKMDPMTVGKVILTYLLTYLLTYSMVHSPS